MSTDSITNPPSVETKSSRKKRGKTETVKSDTTPAASTPVEEKGDGLANGDSASNDSPFIKELQKNIRNVNKKLNAMTKLDAILAENQGVSLDDLVASRKINNDQREQALRKPGLQSTLAQLEEQIVQYKKVDADYQSRIASERESLTSSHKSEIESLKAQLQEEAESKSKAEVRKNLLTFSQFLRAAAARRSLEQEADTEESRAFEGVLLLVYGGDDKAVEAAEKLIEGSDDAVPSVEGTLLSVKYSQVKSASLSYGPFGEEDIPSTESTQEAQAAPVESQETDPTIAHASLSELQNEPNGIPTMAEQAEDNTVIKEASTSDDAANAAAGQQWDNAAATTGSASLEAALDESFEIVPRDPSETEATHEPAQPQSTNSWADDATAAANESSAPAPAVPAAADDGFLEVERRGPRGGHRGQGEGRGGRGGRGRGGFRGDGRGRGRGSFRGDRGDGTRGRGGPRGGNGGANNAPPRA